MTYDFHLGDMRKTLPTLDNTDFSMCIADPPYDDYDLIDKSIKLCTNRVSGTCLFFMYAENLVYLSQEPEQVLFWVKPESTKNTSKKYSRFVEVIAAYNICMNSDLHWSNRTGIFYDRLLGNHKEHPYKKPESMIQRLILNHYPGTGTVLDPFAGSRTVETVCRKLDIPCVSIDIVDCKGGK